MLTRYLLPVLLVMALAQLAPGQVSRDQKVKNDKKKVEAEGFWIYHDLQKGLAEARKTGKPIIVTLRCIPCEECVKLDDELVDRDPRVRPLLEKFVCVRIVGTNGLDLSLFQYDYDQSFAVFLLNADGTIYGRFGTRSHRTSWADDVSIDGLGKALQGALELHAAYPKNKDELAGKRGPKPEFASPELYPFLRDKFTAKLDFEGNVYKSCIHCHQIGDAQKHLFRERKQAMPDEVLFPYPHPKSIGLILDPKERATVLEATADTPAARSGFKKGDVIVSLAGQPLLSMADVQWILHNAGSAAKLPARVQRGSEQLDLTLDLPAGWRQRDDISWRASTWGLRRMATGGMVLETLDDDERKQTGVEPGKLVLRVKHVGQFGPHAAAKNAGVQKGDLVVSFDGKTDPLRETDLIVHALQKRKAGEKIQVTLLRNGKRVEVMLPMQE